MQPRVAMRAYEHGTIAKGFGEIGEDEEAGVIEQAAPFVGGLLPGVRAQSQAGTHVTASEQAYGSRADHEAALSEIQGRAMHDLLPALEEIPPGALADDAAGGAVGGPRLQLAMHAVRIRRAGGGVEAFARTNPGVAELPADQIATIKEYLTAPRSRPTPTPTPTSRAHVLEEHEKAPADAPAAVTLDPETRRLPIDAPLVDVVFLGVATKAHPVLAARLKAAEQALVDQLGLADGALAKALGVQPWFNIQQPKASYHHFALAIDINYETNPHIGGQKSKGGGDEEAVAAIWRACWLTGRGNPVSPAENDRRGRGKGSTGALWDSLHESDQALEAYLGAANDLPRIEQWIAKGNLDTVVAPPSDKRFSPAALGFERLAKADAVAWQAQIRDDLARTHGATASQSNWWKKSSVRTDLGFLDLDRNLVIALREVGGLAWGAADFGDTESGDMMHFDCRKDYDVGLMRASIAAGKSNVP